MLISKRQFIVSVMIFVTLLLLFMGFQIGKEAVSSPNNNKHIIGTARRVNSGAIHPAFATPDKSGKPDGLAETAEWALYIGEESSGYAATAKEWSYYAEIPTLLSKELPLPSAAALPDIIMIEPAFAEGKATTIAALMNKGVDFIFMSLPAFRNIQADTELKSILGIRRCYQETISLKGVHLFKGFLLGGERIFEEDTESETYDENEKLQDLELDIPWYSVRTGTKTFMRGTLKDEDAEAATEKKLKNEDMPAIIWRNHYGNGEAYAVNGAYLQNRRAGMGMLQAMLYERKKFLVYPVINAQVFSVDNFPILTDENQAEVKQIYGRSVTKAQTDIIMPMFITLSSKYGKRPTCFMAVKHNRGDPAQPQQGILKTYLSMIDEMDGELAVSADYQGSLSKSEELKSDYEFKLAEAPDYRVTSVMGSPRELELLPDALKAVGARDIRTVTTSGYTDSFPVIGFLNDSLSCQQTTSDLKKHTFTNELELLGLQTLLAYSNGYYDMSNAFYPESKKDEWQNISRDVFSNLTTYSAPFSAVDCLTATESDDRIRTYFSMEYRVARDGDLVTVTSDRSVSQNATCYFVLRTHEEKVVSVRGGECRQIEENAYLLCAKEETMAIRLSSSLSTLVDMEGSNR